MKRIQFGETWSGIIRLGAGIATTTAVAGVLWGSLPTGVVLAADPQIVQKGTLTGVILPKQSSQAGTIDFANAKPMPLPKTTSTPASLQDALLEAQPLGQPGGVAGKQGNGHQTPEILVPARSISESDASSVAPEAFGTSNHPFTTSRANPTGGKVTNLYPFRAAGKLFFNIGAGSYVCSASLIKKGLVVTAAHCVANFGASQFYTNWRFVPGYDNGTAPYGTWTAANAWVLTSYYNGTEACATYGVVCPNDVAVIRLAPKAGAYPGTQTGFYGYGWNGYGFTPGNLVQITQLGYPVALDSGGLMERTDSYGFVSSSNSNNTIIGSLQTGGSSGGPWLVNFGVAPTLSGTTTGSEANRNNVVGVTSWGYTSTAIKQQGASPFTSNNIVPLVTTGCAGSTAC